LPKKLARTHEAKGILSLHSRGNTRTAKKCKMNCPFTIEEARAEIGEDVEAILFANRTQCSRCSAALAPLTRLQLPNNLLSALIQFHLNTKQF